MAVNYDDKRFKNVESQEKQALTSANNMYNNMINNSNTYYNQMQTAAENYGKQQAEIQQANTDFAIEKIEQQKDLAAKDYTREQKGAYADWQKESNQYGVNAEQLASSGLSRTGYSESSQINMYNTYQNRVSQARDTYNRAVLDYDNGIKEAQLTNNAALAEIAYNALQTKLKLGLDQFQYKNELLAQQLQTQRSISNEYYGRWQDVLKQINTENALAEEKRQFDKQYALQKKAYSSSIKNSSGGATIKSGGNSSGNNNVKINATGTTPKQGGDNYGNSKETQQKSDYYAKNGYQPNYINNVRLKSTGKKVYDVFSGEKTSVVVNGKVQPTAFGNQQIWTTGGSYYIWDGANRQYVDVTKQVVASASSSSKTKGIMFNWGTE